MFKQGKESAYSAKNARKKRGTSEKVPSCGDKTDLFSALLATASDER